MLQLILLVKLVLLTEVEQNAQVALAKLFPPLTLVLVSGMLLHMFQSSV